MAFLLLFKLETSCPTWFCKDRDVCPQTCLCLPKTPVGTIGCSSISILCLSAALGRSDGEEQAGGVGRDLLPHFLMSAFKNYSKEPFGASSVVFGEMEGEEARW